MSTVVGRDRSVKQHGAPKGIDSRTWTRYATVDDMVIAKRALDELGSQRNKIGLVPAPDPHFDSHKIRVIESRNPDWYIKFGLKYWKSKTQFDLQRCRVERAFQRVLDGKVRGNGYEQELLVFLREWWA